MTEHDSDGQEGATESPIDRSSDPASVPTFWELRLTRRLGISPLALGVVTTAGALSASLAIQWAFGVPLLDAEQPYGLHESTRSVLFITVLLGYLLGSFEHVMSANERELLALGLLSPEDVEERRLPREVRTRGRWAGVVGIAAGLVFVEAVQRSLGFDPSALDMLFSRGFGPFMLLILLTAWIAGRIFYSSMQRTALDERIDGPVDLMNLQPFFALGRLAIRTATAFVIGISLLAPWVFIPGFGATFLFFMGAALLIPTLALWLPARSAHRRLREAKRAELEAIDQAIREDHHDALANDSSAQQRMSFRLAYRAHVESLPVWPFEARSFARYALYLLIPLGSWLASAMVERLVEAALD